MLALWNSFRDMDRRLSSFDEMRREMDRLFNDFDAGFFPRPRTRLVEKENELVVRAEMPGMSEKDLEITVDRGMLTIRGERRDEVPEGMKALHRERGTLRFTQSFLLPCKVDPEGAKASLRDGVLELVLPKAEEIKPRQIPVTA